MIKDFDSFESFFLDFEFSLCSIPEELGWNLIGDFLIEDLRFFASSTWVFDLWNFFSLSSFEDSSTSFFFVELLTVVSYYFNTFLFFYSYSSIIFVLDRFVSLDRFLDDFGDYSSPFICRLFCFLYLNSLSSSPSSFCFFSLSLLVCDPLFSSTLFFDSFFSLEVSSSSISSFLLFLF